MTRNEYFGQDILVRIEEAMAALDQAKSDPLVFQDDADGITVAGVLNDAYIAIERLRGARPATSTRLQK